ncbi:Acetate kinase [hydrothermal vent metagenome]|uniref:Acetate kinase n=1 Tax=hydrothermal vent metagenome TaxID=652676 RepID=A0A1W1CMI1_9ZZZZ
MKILVLNAGSSSLKYKLFIDMRVVADGIIESITNYRDGILEVEEQIKKVGVKSLSLLDGVGHRVVHGGELFKESVLVTKEVIDTVRSLIPLAPLHNPANLEGILMIQDEAPSLRQVAVFDTAFHQTIPQKAYMYALPYELYEGEGIRRYGFHGTSHHFVAKKASKLLDKRLTDTNLITLHLGNGASVCAIKNGKSVDTSMGFTPLEGLIMGTRSGDIDPAILLYLTRELKYSTEEIDNLINKKSGLLGISGESDMRQIHKMIEQGDKKAKLALEMFVYRIRKYIGAYSTILGRVDALIFTGGIGENDLIVREMILEDFDILSFVICTDEELEIALETNRVLNVSKNSTL